MQQLEKYRYHLLIILVLVLVRFIWQPMWEQKQESWQKLDDLSGNLDKSSTLIEQQDMIQAQMLTMQQRIDSLQENVPVTSDLDRFKLTRQQDIEALLKANELSLSQLVWREGPKQQDIQLMFMEVRFEGQLSQYMQLSVALEQVGFRLYELLEMSLNIRGNRQGEMGTVTGKLLLSLPVRLEAP